MSASSDGSQVAVDPKEASNPDEKTALEDAAYEIRVIGAPRPRVRDFYYYLLRYSWPTMLGCIVAFYLLSNAGFACLYMLIGGVENARAGSFLDLYFFSVQTMGTIGYGAMAPHTVGANLVMVSESVFSLLVTALSTGLIFAKFSRPTARVLFASHATVSRMNGKKTLALRIGNERSNQIVDARVHVAIGRTERTAEGHPFYKMVDLPLSRSHLHSLSRSWLMFHVIDEASPLYQVDAAVAAAQDMEIWVSVTGIDDTWMQTVHASHRYLHPMIAWDHRPCDVLTEVEGGNVVILDLTKFHLIEPDDKPDTPAHDVG